MSGLAIAMLAVGMHFYGAAAECDPVARRCAQAAMPHLVHYEKVEAVRASRLCAPASAGGDLVPS